MAALPKPRVVSEEAYLAMADASAEKLELIDGAVYAMAGGSPDFFTARSRRISTARFRRASTREAAEDSVPTFGSR